MTNEEFSRLHRTVKESSRHVFILTC